MLNRLIPERTKNYFDFLYAMTEKELKSRYKRAIFGFLWVLLNPILQMLIMGLIFSLFIKIPDYFLFLFSGLLPWQFFSLSLSKATASIVHERSLLQKAKFPIEAIPISIILANFFNMIISVLLFLAILGFIHKIFLPQVLFLIPALAWLLVFTIGLSLLTATLNVKYRDVNFFVQTLLVLWFYITPVLYTLSLTPKSIYPILLLNPLTSSFEIMHIALLNQGTLTYQLLISNLIVSCVIIFSGIYFYKKEYRFFVDWL